MAALLGVYVFVIGALIGSFLNVVIYRVPREESIVTPRSRCPHCGTMIRWYDNIPILSYLVLRGKCRRCGEPISIRYPLVELANALFYLAVYVRFGIDAAALPVAIIVSMTIALIYIDLDFQLLLDVIDLPGIAVGLWIGVMQLDRDVTHMVLSESLSDSLIGAAAGAGGILAIALFYKLVRRIEGMGLGDVKMMGMIGATLGWRPLAPMLLIASLSGALFGIVLAIRRRSDLRFALPFGVFLGGATLVMMFFGLELEEWYRSLLVR